MVRLGCSLHLLNKSQICVSTLVLVLSAWSSANPPVIDISHNMRILKLPNNTKVGSIIYRIRGTDADNDIITFGARGIIGKRMLFFKSVSFFEADVYLKYPLEEKDYNITIFASDPSNQFTEVESRIIVTQSTVTNDSPFLWSENIIRILESTELNELIASVNVRKKENSNLPIIFELRGSENFAIKHVLGPRDTSTAEIRLVKRVDYEKQNLYVLTVVALGAFTNETYDTKNIATIDIVVAIDDIQDTAPTFTNLPNVLEINENTRVGSTIFTIKAEDRDYGSQRNVTYDIDRNSPLTSYFGIDEIEGSIVLRRPVHDIKQEIGTKEPMILNVRAIEVKSSDDPLPVLSTDSNIAIVIVSTDNRRPQFASQHLFATIDENSQIMTPIRWQGLSVPQVTDDDPGLNGTIALHISDPSETFMIQPKRGINQIIFSIVVKDSSKLDYETNSDKQFDIKITATDQSPYLQLNSTIFCTIKLVDINDNIPQFTHKIYEILLPEDSPIGTTVAKIEATDEDSGDFGKVRFTSINGPLSNDLSIDSETGIIILKNNRSIDREAIAEYRVTIEARDELGRGNKNVTEMHIKIVDSNDNKPIFLQPRYDAVLNPDRFSFTQPLVVMAVDNDEQGTPNSNTSYEITGGNYLNKFNINEYSGEITLNSVLIDDRNFKIADNLKNEYQSIKFLPSFVLNVRAHDHGIPYQWSEVQVYIHNPDFLNRTVTFLIEDSTQSIEERKELFESGMSTLTGAKVHIYSIKPQNINKKDSTEVLAWMAYPSQSSVDLNKTPLILSQIMGKDYNSGESPEASTGRAQLAGSNDLKLIIYLLAALILATLIFIIIFLVCWFCFCRNRFRSREKLNEENSNLKSSMNGSIVKHSNDLSRDKRHKKPKKKSKASIQAWNDDTDDKRRSGLRPSSAPNNEPNHYSRNVRANSSQSFQDQYLSNHPSLYQRINKMNRHQRSRVGPQYYDSYDMNDIPSRLSDYHSFRPQNTQTLRSFKGVDNMGYLRTSNEHILIDDLNEQNSLKRTRPAVHHLPYTDKYMTVPKRTEILYIQSPVTQTNEDMLRSISQNDIPYIDDRYSDIDPNIHSVDNIREFERLKSLSKAKQRHIYFNDHKVSDMTIPEEVVVPGMVPKAIQSHKQTIPEPSFSRSQQTNGENSVQNRVEIIDDSRDDQNFENEIQNQNNNNINPKTLISNQTNGENLNEMANYSPYYEETLQITSVSGVPVSIELKESLKKDLNNESIDSKNKFNDKNKRVLTKDNSFENSEKSYDSDSGIGKSVLNPKIDLNMKNSDLLEKKSIFTIAYNDVKTRHLQSAESNTE